MRSFYQHLRGLMTAVLILLLSVDKMTASVYQRQDGRWTLDGDAPGAAIEGRAEWRDSAVGGKALVFNGVDTRLVFADRRWSSLALWFFAADAGPMTVVDGLELAPDGVIAFGPLKTPPGRWFSG